MRIRGVILVAVLLLLAGLPLAPLASPQEGSHRVLDTEFGRKAHREGDRGTAGGKSDGAKALTAAEISRGAAEGLEVLLIDRETHEKAKKDRELGTAINAFAKHRPVTVLGATPADLGIAHGNDRASGRTGYTATAVVQDGEVRFDATFVWDEDPGDEEVAKTARGWWTKEKERDRSAPVTVAAESYSGYDWSLRYSTSYSYSSYPYGVIGYRADFYKSIGEWSGSHDYWTVVFDQTTDPGVNVWGSEYRNGLAHLRSDVRFYRFSNQITDWGPGQHTGHAWINWAMGFPDWDGGYDYVTNSYYSGYAVNVEQYSSSTYFSTTHRFETSGWASGTSYTSEPGMIVRVPQGMCLKIPFRNEAEWLSYSTWTYSRTWIESWREVC